MSCREAAVRLERQRLLVFFTEHEGEECLLRKQVPVGGALVTARAKHDALVGAEHPAG